MKPFNQNSVPATERITELEPANGHRLTEEISSREPRHVLWARMLWAERLFLRHATVLGFLMTILISLILPSRYRSSVRLMPPDDQSGSGIAMLAAFAGKGGGSSGLGGMGSALGSSLGGVAGDLLGMKSSGALFMDMLQGPTVQDNLILHFDLRKVYWDRYWEDARKDLAKHTEITEDRKSGVISVAVSDRDPQRAKRMALAYVDALDQLVAQVSTSSARRQRVFIEQRLKSVKQNLDEASREFSDYASQNGTLDVPSQTKAMVDTEAQLEGNLIAAQSELEGLQQIYTDSNIRVRTLRARVAALKHQVENMSGNKSDLKSNDSQIAGDFPSIRKLPLIGVRWANLYRETKIQETVYELLTQQYELAKIQEAKEIPTVKVLDPPGVPERKSFPPRILIVVLGTLLALLFGSAFVIGSAIWKESESPEKKFAMEIWGQVNEQYLTTRDLKLINVAHRLWKGKNGKNGSDNLG